MARSSTTSIAADSSQEPGGAKMPDEQVDELLAGLPEEQKNIRLERLAGDDPAAPKPPGLREAPAGKVILLNLRYENEVFWVPEVDPETGQPRFVGQQRLEFVDGYLVCSREQADFVKARAPYVHEEPGPDSAQPIMEFQHTGFKTRVPAAYQEHAVRWADNQ